MVDRTSGLVLPLSILVSVAVGAVIGGMFARPSATPASPSSLSMGEVKELTEAIHALRLEMASQREPKDALTEPPAASARSRPSASSEATAPMTDVAKEIREATAELVQAFGELRGSLKHLGSEPPSPVFPTVQPDGSAVSAAAFRTQEEVNRTYLFWSYQQVVDAFGTPAGTGRDKEGTILWWYNGQVEGTGINFWFVDGRVFRVEASKP